MTSVGYTCESFFTASDDNTMALVSMDPSSKDTLKEPDTFATFSKACRSAAVIPSLGLVVSGCADGIVRVHDISSREEISEIKVSNNQYIWTAVNVGETAVAFGDYDRQMTVIDFADRYNPSVVFQHAASAVVRSISYDPVFNVLVWGCDGSETSYCFLDAPDEIFKIGSSNAWSLYVDPSGRLFSRSSKGLGIWMPQGGDDGSHYSKDPQFVDEFPSEAEYYAMAMITPEIICYASSSTVYFSHVPQGGKPAGLAKFEPDLGNIKTVKFMNNQVFVAGTKGVVSAYGVQGPWSKLSEDNSPQQTISMNVHNDWLSNIVPIPIEGDWTPEIHYLTPVPFKQAVTTIMLMAGREKDEGQAFDWQFFPSEVLERIIRHLYAQWMRSDPADWIGEGGNDEVSSKLNAFFAK